MTVLHAVLRVTQWSLLVLAVLLSGPLLALALGKASLRGDWSAATHRSAGLAPDPARHPDAVVQVYAGRAFGWRGAFSDHTWLVAKEAGADRYRRYEVIGWYGGGGRSVVSVSSSRAPDAEWYGAAPRLLRDLRGPAAQSVIDVLEPSIERYEHGRRYRAWPGPNSNTFVADLARMIPALHLTMPSTAIGKDFLPGGAIVARTPSGTGWQVSLFGLVGVATGLDEGLEVNILGLVTGLDVRHPALKLPGLGRIPADG